MSGSNALISQKVRPAPQHPMMTHAKTWKHVSGMAPDDVATKSQELDYALPVLGELAADPNVTSKDVIQAAASAAAEGAIEPSQAVQLISGMPDDPTKLQGWLKNLYAVNLSAQVHMKAALQQQQARQTAASAPEVAPSQVGGAQAPAPVAAPPVATGTPA
jgi:hypothetical protein